MSTLYQKLRVRSSALLCKLVCTLHHLLLPLLAFASLTPPPRKAILTAKWAHTGLTDPYEKAMLVCVAAVQAYFGTRYIKLGIYKPLLALWFAPGLALGSLLF